MSAVNPNPHAHSHSHAHSHAGSAAAGRRRVLWWALIANAGYMVVEIAGGFAFDSLALLADAAHMGSDVVGLAIALVAQSLATRPADTRHTYGWQRAEVLGALANGVLLVATCGWIVYEAIERFGSPQAVDGAGLLVVASVGLVVNLVSAIVLRREQGTSLNMRAAVLHMLTDAAGSVAAIIAGIAVLVADATWVDPAMSLLIAALVLWTTWGLMRDTVNVLLEGAPRGVDVAGVEHALVTAPGVEAVHHLHVWNLGSDAPALSAHIVLSDADSLHEAQVQGVALKEVLAREHGIEHATLELECHSCDDPSDLAGHSGHAAD